MLDFGKSTLYYIFVAIKKVLRVCVWKFNSVYVAPGSWISFDTTIDKFTRINQPSYLEKCDVGKFVACGGRLIVRSVNHKTCYANMQSWAQAKIFASKTILTDTSKGPVVINSSCWIGDSCVLLPGSSLGYGCIIGAGSVVTSKIPDFAVAVGAPARVIKYRFSEECIEFLLRVRWWDWPISKLKANRFFFDIDLSSLSYGELCKLEILLSK